MSDAAHLKRLVELWLELRRQGQCLSPEELCKDCPELLDALRAALGPHTIAIGSGTGASGEDFGATRAPDQSEENATRPAPGLDESAAGGPPPGYEVLGELGKGGMGVVYRARQLRANRIVALKTIRSGSHAGEGELARFRIEAEAAARLQHPHIVQVFEVGEHRGLPFFSQEYCAGGSLARKLKGTPLPPQAAARLLEPLARAMAAAHEHGIVHRDLKPSNVLLAADETPKIADFGLAKRLDDDSGRTRTGVVMGTPSYMAPEQAFGRIGAIGPATDVYALGAIFYECLTGRPPFQGVTVLDTLDQVRNRDPVVPRALNPAIPRDLETVCLKCLRKEPKRRYESAQALADDLRAWLEGRPIAARPVGTLERVAKWARRRPGVAGLLALLAAVLLGSAVGGTVLLVRLNDARKDALDSRDHETAARKRAEEQKRAAVAATEQANAETGRALMASDALRFEAVQREGEAGNESGALDLLEGCRWDRRGWEYRYLRRRYAGRGENSLTLPCPGQMVCVAWQPGGARLAAGVSQEVHVWDAGTGEERPVLKIEGEWVRSVRSVGYSPDGWLLAAGVEQGANPTAMVYLWDADGRLLRTLLGPPTAVRGLCFSPDGTRLVGVGGPERGRGEMRVWQVGTGEEVLCIELPGPVPGVSYAPAGDRLAVALAGAVRLLDAQTGKVLASLPVEGGTARSVQLSPDGRLLAAAVSRSRPRDPAQIAELWVWDARTGAGGRVATERLEASAPVVAFSPDGGRLALAASREGRAHEVLVWRVSRLRPGAPGSVTAESPPVSYRGHVAGILGMCFSGDGGRLASVGADFGVRIWDVREDADHQVLAPPPGRRPDQIEFLAGGKLLVAFAAGGAAHAWDAATGLPLPPPADGFAGAHAVAFGDRGERFAAVSTAGDLTVHDGRSGRLLHRLPPVPYRWGLALRPDGGEIALGVLAAAPRPELPSLLAFYDVATGRERRIVQRERGSLAPHLRYSPDGRLLAASFQVDRVGGDGPAGGVEVWDAAEGRLLGTLFDPRQRIEAVEFRPDGKSLAVAGSGLGRTGFLDLWDWTAGTARVLQREYPGTVLDIAFRPDSGRLACSVRVPDIGRPHFPRGEVRLWDPATGQETLRLSTDGRMILRLRFSPDGQTLAGIDTLGAVHLWRGGGPWEARPVRRPTPVLKGVAFSADGQRLVVRQLVGRDPDHFNKPIDAARAWDLAGGEEIVPAADPLPEQQREATSPDGRLVARTDGSVVRVRRREDRDPDRAAERAGNAAWHQREAVAAEAAGHWFAAEFHLARLMEDGFADEVVLLRRGTARLCLGRGGDALADFQRAFVEMLRRAPAGAGE